jgi:cytochrome c1
LKDYIFAFVCFKDYIFALLTGYVDPPAGVTVGEGQAYNPYFPGGAIGMPQQLYNEGIEYDDGKSPILCSVCGECGVTQQV